MKVKKSVSCLLFVSCLPPPRLMKDPEEAR